MQVKKIFLKNYYDEKDIVECDFGNIPLMILTGPFYPLKKGNTKMFFIILCLQISILIFFLILLGFYIGFISSFLMIFLINWLFSLNYNMIIIEHYLKDGYVPYDYNSSDLLIKKGIYFKLN